MDESMCMPGRFSGLLSLQLMEESQANAILSRLADMTLDNADEILAANREDLSRMSQDNPMYDRLLLDKARIEAIAADLRNVAGLPSPVGTVNVMVGVAFAIVNFTLTGSPPKFVPLGVTVTVGAFSSVASHALVLFE